jgi:hypothetical protein
MDAVLEYWGRNMWLKKTEASLRPSGPAVEKCYCIMGSHQDLTHTDMVTGFIVGPVSC